MLLELLMFKKRNDKKISIKTSEVYREWSLLLYNNEFIFIVFYNELKLTKLLGDCGFGMGRERNMKETFWILWLLESFRKECFERETKWKNSRTYWPTYATLGVCGMTFGEMVLGCGSVVVCRYTCFKYICIGSKWLDDLVQRRSSWALLIRYPLLRKWSRILG